MEHYSLRQRQSFALPALLLVGTALGSSFGVRVGFGPVSVPLLLLLGGVTGLLPLLAGPFTVELDGTRLQWRFGLLRWPSWQLPLARIARVEPARSTWSEGCGVHSTAQGMLYTGGGFDCVRIHTTDGKSLRLGSPDPARLIAYLNARLQR